MYREFSVIWMLPASVASILPPRAHISYDDSDECLHFLTCTTLLLNQFLLLISLCQLLSPLFLLSLNNFDLSCKAGLTWHPCFQRGIGSAHVLQLILFYLHCFVTFCVFVCCSHWTVMPWRTGQECYWSFLLCHTERALSECPLNSWHFKTWK